MYEVHIVPLASQAVDILRAKEDMMGHGFRTMASTMLNERGWRPDLTELQLAMEQNKVHAAYNRAWRVDGRQKMMKA